MDQYGWNQRNEYQGYGYEPHKRSHGFETASLVLGILGLLGASCGVGIFLGALAMIFAHLSKGSADTLGSQGKAGFLLGITAIVATALTFVVSFVFVINQFGGIDGFMEQYQQLYDSLYGISATPVK